MKFIIKNKKVVLCILIIAVIGYLIYKNQLDKSYVLQKESFETYLYYHKVNDTKLTNGKDLYIFVVSTKCKDDSIDINKINVQLRLKDNYKEYSAYEINEAYAQKYFENHVEQKGKKIYRSAVQRLLRLHCLFHHSVTTYTSFSCLLYTSSIFRHRKPLRRDRSCRRRRPAGRPRRAKML